MKQYKVENAIRNDAQVAGIEPYDYNLTDNFVGDYIDAEDESEAVQIAMQYIIENAADVVLEAQDKDSIIFRNIYTDELVEYYNFTAKCVEHID